jgi:hypothetical protein
MKKLILTLGLLAFFVTTFQASGAINSKTYSGIYCQSVNPKNNVRYDNNNGGMVNNENKAINVVCPIVTDSNLLGSLKYVEVNLISTSKSFCQLDNGTSYSTATGTQVITSPATRIIKFGDGGNIIFNDFFGKVVTPTPVDSFFIKCFIPRAALIQSYRVDEN